MTVCRAAKYLGQFMGPEAAAVTWKAASAKYRLRVRQIAAYGSAAFESAKDYNSTVLPVLSYISMLFPPPPDLIDYERHALTTIFHVPPCALGKAELLHLDNWGGPQFRSLVSSCNSMAIRTAWRFKHTWSQICKKLHETAETALQPRYRQN